MAEEIGRRRPARRVRFCGLVMALLFGTAPCAAQSAIASQDDAALAATIEGLVEGFGGDVGVYIQHPASGTTVEIAADELFPTASLIKVPILTTLFDRVHRGEIDLDARVPYPDTLSYAYVESTDVVGYMEPGDTLPVSELAFLMLTVSDNVASLWLQAMVGGGTAVNEWLQRHGFDRTRVNSRTPGREAARAGYGWGQTTPREMARLFEMIRNGGAVSPEASEQMYRLLTKSYWTGDGLSQIPPTVQVASKQGFISRSRSEILLVNAPSGDYVLAVMTRNQEDTSYDADNEGLRLIRAISRAAYRHFNPADSWEPRPPPAPQ